MDTNADSSFYEIFLAIYNGNGFQQCGITDLEGLSNSPTSLILDGMFLYVAGVAQSLEIGVLNNQILCKYALSDLVSTHSAPHRTTLHLALPLEGLPAGTYFVILKQNGLPTHTEHVVKL